MTVRPVPYSIWMQANCSKKVDGGYLLETPNPWLFGRGRSYIVSEEQRQALFGDARSRHPVLRILLISAGIIVFTGAVSGLWAAFSPNRNPSPLDVLGMSVAILVPLYAVLILSIRRQLRRMEPITAKARPTEMKLTTGERYRVGVDTMSTKLLVVCVAIWFLSAIVSVVLIATMDDAKMRFGDYHPYLAVFQVAVSLMLACYFSYGLRRRFRRTG